MSSLPIYQTKRRDLNSLFEEPQTTAEAVFQLLITLSEKASNSRLIVSSICQYLEASKSLTAVYKNI